MPLSAWLIGSVTTPAYTVDFGSAQVVTAGSRYIRSATTSLSLLAQIAAAMTAAGVTGASAVILESRRVRLSGSSSFAIDFVDTELGLLLGFSSDTYASATSRTAENVSPLLWSPGYLATPSTPEGTAGYVVNDRSVLASADMTRQRVDTFNVGLRQELAWSQILSERMRVADSSVGGGTFHRFLESSAKLGNHLLWYPEQFESISSAVATTWGSSFGPYVVRLDAFDDSWYSREVPNVDLYSPLTLPLMQVTEYA